MKRKPLHIRSLRSPGFAIRRGRKMAYHSPPGQERPQRVWSLLLPPSFPPDRHR